MKLIGVHQSDWDEYLDPVLFSIRTSVQESTKYTPFFLMHGREARFPFEAEKSCTPKLSDIQERIDCISKLKDAVFPIAKKHIDSSQKRQKDQYQKRKGIVKSNIRPGNMVLRLNMKKRTKKGHKMEDTWLGPYRVLKVSSRGSCNIQCVKTGKDIKQKVNVSQLKPYVELCKVNEEEVMKVKTLDTVSKGNLAVEAGNPVKTELKSQVLENQLFDDSILRLWRTGAGAWESMEDDHYNVGYSISIYVYYRGGVNPCTHLCILDIYV